MDKKALRKEGIAILQELAADKQKKNKIKKLLFYAYYFLVKYGVKQVVLVLFVLLELN
ncbi:hypothetical protein IGI65_001510 [Enterococcus sp. DIV0755b]|uniref:hypothetical protein n=1 Tax=Enterococcus sp. DIV0755b TaxID=2774657 RepID=UPI003F257ADC